MLVGGLGFLAAPGSATGQAAAPVASAGPSAYLRSLGLGSAQLRAASTGQAVALLLKTEDQRDVAVFGMVAVRASPSDIVARALDLQGVMTTPASQSGAFGDPPLPADVSGVAFDRSEYKALRTCRPADCDFKLSAEAMRAFNEAVDWSSPNARAQAHTRLRADLLDLVTDYRRRGTAAMPAYDDGPGTRSAADAFEAMMAQSARLLTDHAPALQRYLRTYPAGRPAGTHDFLYWSEERRPRTRPTLLVHHVVVHAPPNGIAFIARKQLYASHYFEGALELLAVVDAAVPNAAPVSYLITVRRFRFDYLPGGILNVRGRVRSQLVKLMREDLLQERAAIERTTAMSGSRLHQTVHSAEIRQPPPEWSPAWFPP